MPDASPEEFPMLTEQFNDELIPDLREIPEDRWEAALRPLTLHARKFACNRGARSPDQWMEMAGIMGGLELEDMDRRHAARSVVPELPVVAVPEPTDRHGHRRRQVGFRIGEENYENLSKVAALHGVAPATLARMLTIRGVNAALAAARREGSAPS